MYLACGTIGSCSDCHNQWLLERLGLGERLRLLGRKRRKRLGRWRPVHRRARRGERLGGRVEWLGKWVEQWLFEWLWKWVEQWLFERLRKWFGERRSVRADVDVALDRIPQGGEHHRELRPERVP
jgi:hypothetical protein